MEKQRTKTITKFTRRLLILGLSLLFSNVLSAAETLTPEVINNFVIIPSSTKDFYTDTDIKYELFIPSLGSYQVEFVKPENTPNYTIKSARKYNNISDIDGTILEFIVNFNNPGDYTIPELDTRIIGKKYKLKFETISIKINPQRQKPVIFLNFRNGTQLSSQDTFNSKPVFTVNAGEKVYFTTQVKFILQLNNEIVELPKDSLFTKIKGMESIEKPYHEKETLGNIFPVSEFCWTPLLPGTVQFPEVKMAVVSSTGAKTEVKMPAFTVEILENTNTNTASNNNDAFEDAFTAPVYSEHDQIQTNNITIEQCEKLARLRSAEKHSILRKQRAERIEYELSLGLPATQTEFRLPFLFVFLFLTVLYTIFLVLSIVHKRFILILLTTITLIPTSIGLIFSINKIGNTYAISKGCTIQSIPEMKVESKSELPAGTRINITAKSSEWIYVELGETCGWCHEDEVILIK